VCLLKILLGVPYFLAAAFIDNCRHGCHVVHLPLYTNVKTRKEISFHSRAENTGKIDKYF
jgi:hypothetical protein